MANEKYTVIELAEQIGVPRTTINDWIGKYAAYMDYQVQGKRRIYTESTLTVLKEISELRNGGMSAADIEKNLSQKFPVHPILQPRAEEDSLFSNAREPGQNESAEDDAENSDSAESVPSSAVTQQPRISEEAMKEYSLQISRKSDEIAAMVRERFEEILETVKAIRANAEANGVNMANYTQQFTQNYNDMSQMVSDHFQEMSGSLNEMMQNREAAGAEAGKFAVQIQEKSAETAAMVQDRFTQMMNALNDVKTHSKQNTGIRISVTLCLAAAVFSVILGFALFFLNLQSSEKASKQSAEWEKKAKILENDLKELKQGYLDGQETFKDALKAAEDKFVRIREAERKAQEEKLKAERAVMEKDRQEIIQSRDILDSALNEQIEKLQAEVRRLKAENQVRIATEQMLKSAEVKPAEVKPAAPKPVEVKPAEVKPAAPKPVEVKPAEVKPAAPKPVPVK